MCDTKSFVLFALQVCKHVNLYGFDAYTSRKRSYRYHYFDNVAGFTDPLIRGLATASSCHGFGTAALAATEPAALPFCALSYGLTGIAASLWAAVPAVQSTLKLLAGAPSP